jgi:hypothetical protein
LGVGCRVCWVGLRGMVSQMMGWVR